MRAYSLAALAVLVTVANGCTDPCAGVFPTCSDGRASYSGEVVLDHYSQLGEGIQVEFVRTGGAQIESDTLRSTTDFRGVFRLETKLRGGDEVRGDLVIHAPGPIEPTLVPDLVLTSTRSPADSRHMGRWRVRHPFFGTYVHILWRGSQTFAEDVPVLFTWRGGVEVRPSPVWLRSNPIGQVWFEILPWGVGEVIGELAIYPPFPYRSEVKPIRLDAVLSAPSVQHLTNFWIGPYFPQFGLLVWGDTKEPAADVEVEFVRTGGVRVEPARIIKRTTADPVRNFQIAPVMPGDSGTVVGDVIVRPPAPYPPFTIRGIELDASYQDLAELPVIGVWEIPRGGSQGETPAN